MMTFLSMVMQFRILDIQRICSSFAEDSLDKQVDVEDGNNDGNRPREIFHPTRVDEYAHLGFLAGELHQGYDGKTQL